jgi:hypothetical protein
MEIQMTALTIQIKTGIYGAMNFPLVYSFVVVKLNWPQISGHSNNSVLPSQASYLRYERAA